MSRYFQVTPQLADLTATVSQTEKGKTVGFVAVVIL